ncbi:MAG: TlpA family protein disulfide reductase [Bacteroides sp.]|nr:TlpA family protein disulfide reductase [Bacteroides sp.]
MKKILRNTMMMLLGMMLLAGCSMDNRIIEKPVFLASNTTSIEVSKVTLTDSTTVLDIFARYQPKYWIRIASSSYLTDDKGKTYPIQSGIGIDLDKEFWMPESGEAEFQLVFPRLKNGAKYFDFAEGPEVQGGFNIWGVQLKSNELPELKLPKAMLAQEVDKEAPLEVPELKYGAATVKGKVLDYQQGMPATLKVIINNRMTGYEDVDVNIEADGTFTYTVDVLGATEAVVFSNEMAINAGIYVEPGQTSEVYLNIREASRIRSKFHADEEPYGRLYYYSGPLQNLVREKSEANALMAERFGTVDTYDFTQKPDVLLDEYKKNLLYKVEEARKALVQSSLAQSTKTYMENEIDIRLLYGLQEAPNMVTSEYMKTQKEWNRDTYVAFWEKMQKGLPSDYVNKELYAVLNNPVSLLVGAYQNFVRRSDFVQKSSGIEEGIFVQIGSMAKLYQCIKDFAPLTDVQKEEMKALPEACQQYLIAENEKLLETIEANKKKTGFRVNEVGEVANEDLFASIISQFRGKVLLVDFWATWCGPCRMANKEMAPMKEELKDKDIVYVYITGETSPKGTWENMIPDIHGEHFRVTDKQWAYLNGTMGIEGVPTYFIIDREGNIKFKTVGFPGVAKMKEELLKVLDK